MRFRLAQNKFEFIYCEMKSIILKKNFLVQYGCNDKFQKICEIIKKKRKLLLFPYEFTNKYRTKDIIVYKDSGLYYVMIDGKKMYLNTKSKYLAKRYVKNILLEQDEQSAHQYCDKKFYVDKGDVLFDIGSAEGYFTLINIDKIQHAYLFECNPKWITTLKKTFEPYRDKVTIIPVKVSNMDTKDFRTIDSICAEYNIEKIDFIKMDIEGFEENAIEGMSNTIKNNNLKMAICCYHTGNQEKRIKQILSRSFKIRTNNNYMIYYYDYDISKQFLRHGVLKCTKK